MNDLDPLGDGDTPPPQTAPQPLRVLTAEEVDDIARQVLDGKGPPMLDGKPLDPRSVSPESHERVRERAETLGDEAEASGPKRRGRKPASSTPPGPAGPTVPAETAVATAPEPPAPPGPGGPTAPPEPTVPAEPATTAAPPPQPPAVRDAPDLNESAPTPQPAPSNGAPCPNCAATRNEMADLRDELRAERDAHAETKRQLDENRQRSGDFSDEAEAERFANAPNTVPVQLKEDWSAGGTFGSLAYKKNEVITDPHVIGILRSLKAPIKRA